MLKLKRADITPRPEQKVSFAAMPAFGYEFSFPYFDDFIISSGNEIVDNSAKRNLQDDVLACFTIAKLRLAIPSGLGVGLIFSLLKATAPRPPFPLETSIVMSSISIF